MKLKQVPIKQQIRPQVLELLLSVLENCIINKRKKQKGSDKQMFSIKNPSPFKEMPEASER